MGNFRFTSQENQFTAPCVPCTAAQFNTIVNSGVVDWKITTRQAIEKAVNEGQSLDRFIHDTDFQKFRLKQLDKPRAGKLFAELTIEQQLLQWANDLKMWLPCFIFAVREFDGTRRKQAEIKELSGLFMFDGDKLPIDPRDVYERTQRQNFPWAVRLAHKTSSGHGIRLVCEALPEIGNIADNQIELARELGLLNMTGTTGKPVTDDSCIDASRISYAPRKCDIYYINEDKLFNF